MSLVRVVTHNMRIIDHLAEAGNLNDSRGDSFVDDLVSESLKDHTIQRAAMAHMLTKLDLVHAYKTAVTALYPDVFLMHGFRPIISASMPFFDRQNFGSFAAVLCSDSTVGDDPVIRREMIAEQAVVFCHQIWLEALAAGKVREKEWAFECVKGYATMEQKKGCLSMIAAPLLLVGSTIVPFLWS